MNQAEHGNRPALTASPWLWLCRVAILVALSASAALYVQYLNPIAATFCGLESGCEAVRRFGYSYFFGTPFLSIPLVGLIAYGTLFILSIRDPDGPWTARLAGIGAVLGLALLVTQAMAVKAFCWLCVVADVSSAFVFAFAAADRRYGIRATNRDPLRAAGWLALAFGALALPVGWAKVKPEPPVPLVIQALYVPGKINVVEFADFECPFCRMYHPILKRVLHDYPAEKVHFVRKHVPLPSHLEARPAAVAAICADVQGKGEVMADRLMTGELSAEAVRESARAVGVDRVVWDRCLSSPDPARRVDQDVQLLTSAGMYGLPTTYVQGTRLLGAVSEAALRDAMDRAARGDHEFEVSAPAYVAVSFALLGAIAWLGRRRRGNMER